MEIEIKSPQSLLSVHLYEDLLVIIKINKNIKIKCNNNIINMLSNIG